MYRPEPTASRYCPLLAFPFELPLKVFKTRLLGRGFHTLIKNVLFPSSTDVGSHNPPPFEAQRPRWHLFPSPIDVRSHTKFNVAKIKLMVVQSY